MLLLDVVKFKGHSEQINIQLSYIFVNTTETLRSSFSAPSHNLV